MTQARIRPTPVRSNRFIDSSQATSVRTLTRFVLLLLLGPILWMQSRRVRRVTPLMPEARGPRLGESGSGPIITVLIAGDSGAAGVGVESQDQGLCGQLALQLGVHHTVRWQLMAVSGLDSPGLVQLLLDAPKSKFDVVILSVGVNDATALRSPEQWLQWQHRLAALVQERFDPDLLIHSAMPPMRGFVSLPQPLRWFMGRWTTEMNQRLEQWLPADGNRVMTSPFEGDIRACLASDGFHPGVHGYKVWADAFSRTILDKAPQKYVLPPLPLGTGNAVWQGNSGVR